MGAWNPDDFARGRSRASTRSSGSRSPESREPRRGLWWFVLGAGVLAIAAGLLFMRQPLSDWLWPETRAQQLQADAARALAQGRLTSPDGRGARELYVAALAVDPDRSEARKGLARVGAAALTQAEAAIQARRYPVAHRNLALARELNMPRARVDAVAKRLREREAIDAGIPKLLSRAATARKDGRLEGSDESALALYQRVLTLQPSNLDALEGREDTLADLLQQARASLSRGEVAEASARIHRVQAADAGHVDLPDLLAQLTQIAERRRGAGDAELRRGRLAEALQEYLAALEAMPGDAAAERGMAEVANAYAARSQRYAADFRFDDAEAALRDARAIALQAPGIAEAERRLQQARQSELRYGSRAPSGDRQRRLRELLADASAAEARGDLMTPPGDSAFDKVRAARALAPNDPAVRAAMNRLLPAAQACFERELRGNRLVRARECLDARVALEGDNAGVREARRRLAQRWIAVGDERLGAGELNAAQAALTAARELDPNATGLGEFADRLRAAAAAN